ncbi:Iron-regulated protein frpC [Francisella tularensis subsp. novicida PA10-7858]|nr:Iron-regulated protein frpC [Francisella tularensis subsp. novicida PA10-7858]
MSHTVETFKEYVSETIEISDNETLKSVNNKIDLIDRHEELHQEFKKNGWDGLVKKTSEIIKEQANPISLTTQALQVAVVKHLVGAAINNPQKFLTPLLEGIPILRESQLTAFYRALPEITISEVATTGTIAASVASGGTGAIAMTLALDAFVLGTDYFDAKSLTHKEITAFVSQSWNKLSNSNDLKGFIGDNTFLGNTISGAGQAFLDLIGKANEFGAYLGGKLYELTHDEIALNSSQSGNQETLRVIRRDPLTLDLDGDGIETVSADGSVLFDSNADGIKRGTGWVGADDGLLVRDIDGSGTIDNGQELFGDATVKSDGSIATDGFDALSDLDSNNDGVFDANDTAFEDVKVWQDKNQDGISQADELMSLSEAGIADINLNATTTTTATDGGVISKTGTFTRTDGTTSTIGNLNFNQNNIYREFTDNLDTTAFNGMMNMAGIGEVRDLQEAATQNQNLADLLGKMNTESYTAKLGLADDLLTEWTKTSNFSDTNNLLK